MKHYHSANPSLSYHGVAGAAPTAFFQGVSPTLPYHGVTLFQPRSINHIRFGDVGGLDGKLHGLAIRTWSHPTSYLRSKPLG